MALSSPTNKSIQWAFEVVNKDWESIAEAFRTIKPDDNFPEKICALIHALKETQGGDYYHDVVGQILDTLDENPELHFLGAGSFSACFRSNSNVVYKFNILGEDIDASVSYATQSHNNPSPFAPFVANVCHYEESYCIQTELLTPYERQTYTYPKITEYNEVIMSKDSDKFFKYIKQLIAAEVDGEKPNITLSSCKNFIELIHNSINSIQDFRTKMARLDTGSDNMMWRENQIVFNDPMF